MKIVFSLFVITLSFLITSAQTCVGTFRINMIDSATLKPIGKKLEKDIWYIFDAPEGQFYNNASEVYSFEELLKNKTLTVRHNEAQYKFIDYTDDKDDIEFLPFCGEYLVRLELSYKKDTMRLGIYNIPAHQSFLMDSVKFMNGDFFIDLRADERLSDAKWDERGWFVFSPAFIEKVEKKQD